MPSVTYDSYLTWYQERADLGYAFAEEGFNRYGAVSHSTASGDGAQYDPLRVSQYAVFGFRLPGRLGHRRIPNYPAEGPHETCGALCFSVPLDAVTLDSAYLTVTAISYAGNGAHRLYGVAAGNFTTRQLDARTGYPMTYRGEFHQATWGAPRRYRADSLEYDQPHTVAEVTWTWGTSGTGEFTTPDIAPVVQEILDRDDWANGNRLCLILAPNGAVTPDYSAPDLYSFNQSSPEQFASWASTTPPRLTLNY